MATFTPGPAVGSISGSIGGTVFSHNRGGMYMRNRSIPVVSTTGPALDAKQRLADMSALWRARTTAERLQWATYAQNNPIVNRLGQAIIMTGHQAYVALNTRIDRAGGTRIDVPPIAAAPGALLTTTLTGDIGTGTTELAFTATPLGATERLWLRAAVVNSASINYTKNLEKLISVTALAQASPYDYQTDIEARFGTLIVGQKIVMFSHVFDEATGLLSAPRRDEVIVIDTP